MNQLRQGQLCPLHHSYYCCGRKPEPRIHQKRRTEFLRGVTIIEDPHHPRGYRERCSPAELKRRKDMLLASGRTSCFYCGKAFETYDEIALAHREPKGMGGARHDDHIGNLALSCKKCNVENGSKRPASQSDEERTA